jgi:uncharacterized protein (DUF1330 family)
VSLQYRVVSGNIGVVAQPAGKNFAASFHELFRAAAATSAAYCWSITPRSFGSRGYERNRIVKSSYKLFIAIFAGVLVGVAANAAVQGQELNTMRNTAPLYFVSEVNAITDTDALKSYRAKVGDTLAPFNGHYHLVIRASNVQSLEGDAPPVGIAVIAWDSLDHALAWYNSPAYAAIRPIFQAATKGRRTFIVQGVHPEP